MEGIDRKLRIAVANQITKLIKWSRTPGRDCLSAIHRQCKRQFFFFLTQEFLLCYRPRYVLIYCTFDLTLKKRKLFHALILQAMESSSLVWLDSAE